METHSQILPMESIVLSPSQSKAVEALSTHDVLNLIGPAGTGKTTTITEWAKKQKMIDETHSCALCKKDLPVRVSSKTAKNPNRAFVSCTPCNYFSWADVPSKPICFVAPTHTAADVIKNHLESSLSHVSTVTTLASLLQYHQVTNPSTAEQEFRPRGQWVQAKDGYNYIETRDLKKSFADKKVIIIDESSMMTESYSKELISLQKLFSFTLVFCGDHYQLNPVNAKMMFPVSDVPTVELKEQHRSSNSGVSSCYAYLREAVRTNGAAFSWECLQTEGIQFVKECPCESDTPLVLAWTNAAVHDHNQKLRESRLGKEKMSLTFAEGDIIVVTRPIVHRQVWTEWADKIRNDQQLAEPVSEYLYRNGKRLLVTNAQQEYIEYQ